VIAAVTDVNLSIDAQQFVVIVGPSGSGKTTLLNLIGLIDTPTSGTVIFQGIDTSQLSARQRRQLRFTHLGFIFQTFNLIPTLTALENVELPLAFLGRPSVEQRVNACALLESVGLSHRLCHKPHELSVGEMQRVAIARALINQPALILADEPTGELDSSAGSAIIQLLADLCRIHHTTVVAATHDEQMMDMATHQYRLHDGRIVR
jgi:putative ABC transport system ATP-binding protein